MAQHPRNAVVAFEDLEIGTADPGQVHPDEDFTGSGLRKG